MSQQKPQQRGGRVLDKATPEQVMGLARNLPLTHSVPGKAPEDATPGRLGFLANLFEKENASRAESKRRRLLKQAGFPQSKTLEGYDRGHGLVPRRLGTRTAGKPGIRVFCQVVIGQCGVSFPSEKAVGFSPVRNWPVIA
ncbi:MAG: hypothetical protein E6160_09485, partial [Bifidobacterium bifidum]|nr:hypothetical protein [Bifidobacterium bifidum]